jgi:CRP-like cAMP-binding protein/chromosome segregation ATPase
MGLAATNDDGALLKNLVPLNALSDEQLGPLLSHISTTKVKKGEFLFKEDDLEEQNIYLLTGKIALIAGGKEVDSVNSGSETARYPLAHQFPRLFSAKAKSAVTFVSIDSRLLSDMLLRSQSESEETEEEGDLEGGDWMSQLLLSPIFQRIPPANMQQVMMRMEEVTLSAGEVVFKQGDEGTYYYMVSRGRCAVTRHANETTPPIKVAEIGAGSSFGEEALLAQVPRSCTVTMQSDGQLIRLNKEDFLNLVSGPLSHPLSYEDAVERVGAGAKWLDIRLPEAFEASTFEKAINLPTFSLRFQSMDLAVEGEYITCSDTPELAASAAFLLLERGYVAYHLDESICKALVKQNSPVVDAEELEESNAEELESDLEEAQENKLRLKQEQVKLRRLEKLYLKTKQGLETAEQEKTKALEAEEKAAKKFNLLEAKLNKSENQNTELETMEQARDDALTELEELNESMKETRDSHLLREGELKEQVTCLQIELDDVGETNETQQSEYAENQKIIADVNQQLEKSENAHVEQQQVWQTEREQLESESAAQKEQLEALESGSEASVLKLQQEMELLQQELVVSQQSNASHEDEYSELKETEQALLAKQLEKEKNCKELQQQLDELKNRTNGLDEGKAEQQSEIEKLTLELEKANEKMALDSGEQHQHLEQVQGELAQEQEKFVSEKEAHLKQVESLEQQLEEAASAGGESNEERAQQQEQIATLTQELKEQTEQHEADALEQSELATEKDEQLKQIASLEQRLEDAASAGGELNEERAQQQEQIATLTQELKEQTEQHKADVSEQSELAAEKDEQLKQITSLEQQLEEVTSARGELSEEQAQQQEQIALLTQELKEQTERHEADASEQSELAAEKDEQLKEITQLKDELKLKQGELDIFNNTLNQQEETHQQTLEETKVQVKTLENKLQKLDQQVDEADSQLNREKIEQEKHIVSLKQELGEVKDNMGSAIAAHHSEQSVFQSEVAQLQSALDESNRHLDQQKGVLETKSLEQSEEIQLLKKQLVDTSNAESDLDKERESQEAELLKKVDELEVKLKAVEEGEEESISAFQEMIDELMVRKDDFKGKCEQLQLQLEQLTEERNGQSKVMQKLTLQLDKLQADSTSTEATEQLQSSNVTLQKERDSVLERMKVSQGEVDELRAVIEKHVEEIKLAQSGGDNDSEQGEALQRELETVRLQTAHDIKKLRCELELAQSQPVDERNPAQVMAEQQMRQELDSIQGALKDKEVLLNDASRSMRKMEDSLEERDANADRLQLEIDRLQEMMDGMLQK